MRQFFMVNQCNRIIWLYKKDISQIRRSARIFGVCIICEIRVICEKTIKKSQPHLFKIQINQLTLPPFHAVDMVVRGIGNVGVFSKNIQ